MFNLHRAIRYFILIQLMIFPLAVASDSVKTSEFKITDIPEDINALPGTPLNTDTDIQKSLDKTHSSKANEHSKRRKPVEAKTIASGKKK